MLWGGGQRIQSEAFERSQRAECYLPLLPNLHKIKPIYLRSEIYIYILIVERITACVYFAAGKHDKISGRIANISHFLSD